MTKNYPRVLICNATALHKGSGTAITLCNLFQNYPRDKMALLSSDRMSADVSVCKNSWQLKASTNSMIAFFRNIAEYYSKNSIIKNDSSNNETNKKIVLRPQISNSYVSSLLHGYGDCLTNLCHRMSLDCWRWLDEFQPEIIYTMLGSTQYCKLSIAISKKYKIPIAPHVTDDWYNARFADNPFLSIPRIIFRHQFRKVYKRANLGIAFSDLMAQEYQKEFHVPHTVIMNISSNIVEKLPNQEWSKNRPFRFVYIGGLHMNRWTSIRDIGQALVNLHQKGILAELIIHCPELEYQVYSKSFPKSPIIKFGGTLITSEIDNAIDDSDMPIHVESFDKQSRKETRLSVSTKIPTYFSRGKAIFAYGPPEVASCQYIASTQSGIVVTEENIERLSDELLKIINDEKKRTKLAENAWETAKKEHSVDVINERLRSVLCQAVENGVGLI
ncbi:MAG: hypothetical protein LBJ67_13015 [Planctomycetaceae bacterium]|nr:hypothetical protein [Planctomycetaceae bacterium]